jgi:hypothetical protein
MDMNNPVLAEALLYGVTVKAKKPLPREEYDKWLVEAATNLMNRCSSLEIPLDVEPKPEPPAPVVTTTTPNNIATPATPPTWDGFKDAWIQAIVNGKTPQGKTPKGHVVTDAKALLGHLCAVGNYGDVIHTPDIMRWLAKYKHSFMVNGRPKRYTPESVKTGAACLGTYLESVGVFVRTASNHVSRSWKLNMGIPTSPAQQSLPLVDTNPKVIPPAPGAPMPPGALRKMFYEKFSGSKKITRSEITQFVMGIPHYAYLKNLSPKRVSSLVSALMVPLVNRGLLTTSWENGAYNYTWT